MREEGRKRSSELSKNNLLDTDKNIGLMYNGSEMGLFVLSQGQVDCCCVIPSDALITSSWLLITDTCKKSGRGGI